MITTIMACTVTGDEVGAMPPAQATGLRPQPPTAFSQSSVPIAGEDLARSAHFTLGAMI